MARANVVVVTCDRCGTKNEEPVGTSAAGAQVNVQSQELKGGFEDLCDRCKKRVRDLVCDILLIKRENDKDDEPEPQSGDSGTSEEPEPSGFQTGSV